MYKWGTSGCCDELSSEIPKAQPNAPFPNKFNSLKSERVIKKLKVRQTRQILASRSELEGVRAN
ncbi:hypothetical protein GBA52_022405, partial [Prunus armeniaca]